MTKKYEREENLIEQLEKQIRELKSINRQLLKKLKVLNRGYHKFLIEDGENEAVEEAQEIAKKICWDCNIGNYELVIIANRRFRKCSECGKKGKISII